MVYDTGKTSFFKLKKEASWGTAIVPDADVGLLEATGSFTESQGVEQNYGTGSRKNNQLTYGKYGVNGSLTGKLCNGRLLAYALGSDTPSGTGPTTHTLGVLDGELESFTLGQYHKTSDKGDEIVGCKINDFNLSLDTGGILEGTFNYIAKGITKKGSTVGTRTAPTETILPSYTGTVSWNSGAVECKTFNFNYANNLGDDEYSIGDRRRKAITEGEIGIDGSFVLVFENHDVYADFQTTWSTGKEVGTARALSLVASTGATTGLYELSLGMTDVALNERTKGVELDNSRVVSEFNFTAKSMGTVTYKDQFVTTYIA